MQGGGDDNVGDRFRQAAIGLSSMLGALAACPCNIKRVAVEQEQEQS
jgi:hypothetical protein